MLSMEERYKRLAAQAEEARKVFRVVEVDLSLRTKNELGKFVDEFAAIALANERADDRVRAVVKGAEFIGGVSWKELSNDDWKVVQDIAVSI